MNNPFLHRLIKEEKGDVVHTSVYAKARASRNIGSDSTQSFEDRQKIEQNRTMVKGYSDAKITNEFGRLSWQAKRNIGQSNADFGRGRAINDRNTSSFDGDLKGRLNNDKANYGRDSGRRSLSNVRRGPAEMPSRKNPGISR